MGFVTAPRYITQTKAAKDISDLYNKRYGGKTISKEEGEKRKKRSELRRKYREGELTYGELDDAITSEVLTERGLSRFLQMTELPSDVRLFMVLNSDDQNEILKTFKDKDIKRYLPHADMEVKEKWQYMEL